MRRWRGCDPLLVFPLLFGVLLRLPGLSRAVYQDEVHIIRAVSHYLSVRTLVPPWFDWPPLFGYLAVPLTALASWVGSWGTGLSPGEWALIESAFIGKSLFLGNRFFALGVSVGVGILLWHCVPRRCGSWARSLAVLAYAVSPVAVEHGAYGLPEEGVALSVCGVLLFCRRYLESGKAQDLLLSGVFVGLGGAFKFNGAILGAACLVAAMTGPGERWIRVRHLVLAGIVSVVVFLLLTPSFWLTPLKAIEGIVHQTGHVSRIRPGAQYARWIGMPCFLTRHEPLAVLGMVVALVALGRSWVARPSGVDFFKRAEQPVRLLMVLLTVPLMNFLAVGGWTRMDPNYWYPTLPATAILLAVGSSLLFFSSGFRPWWVATVTVFGLLILWLTAPPPLARDNYDVLRDWLAANLPEDAVVVRDSSFTPKVWDEEVLAEFLRGPGRGLSPAGRAAFQARLENSPRAKRVLLRVDWQADEPALADLPSGAWILTSGLPVRRILDHPAPKPEAAARDHARHTAFYRQLFDLDGSGRWERVSDSANRGTQPQYAFRKR